MNHSVSLCVITSPWTLFALHVSPTLELSTQVLVMASNTAPYTSLLKLPTELLDRITGCLNDEVLPILRLTCRTLHAAVVDRFCDAYIAHLGCWIVSKDRWERLYNLLSARSLPLFDKAWIITLTMDELELRTADDFVSVSGFPYQRTHSNDHGRDIELEQYCHVSPNIAMEAAAVEHRGVADLTVMLRVMERAKILGCSIRLELAPASPFDNKMPPLHSQAKDVQIQLQQAIAQVRPRIETINLDRVRHMCLENTFMGLEDEVQESFASLREFTLTPLMGDYKRRHKVKHTEVARAILTSAQHLRKLSLHVSSRLIGNGAYERVQRWAPPLLLANGLGELESLTLRSVPLSLEILLEILRRCSSTLTHLELSLDPKACFGDAWMDVWERLASMKRLRYLRLDCPWVWFNRGARTVFLNRNDVETGLASLVNAERSRDQNRMP